MKRWQVIVVKLGAGLALAASTTGCAASALPLAYATYGLAAGTTVASTAIMAKQADIAQQNADTYRQAVQAAQQGAAPQCRDAEVAAKCPLYQYRHGLYRAKCADGSGLEVGPGRLTVIPPVSERPHPWEAEGCVL